MFITCLTVNDKVTIIGSTLSAVITNVVLWVPAGAPTFGFTSNPIGELALILVTNPAVSKSKYASDGPTWVTDTLVNWLTPTLASEILVLNLLASLEE